MGKTRHNKGIALIMVLLCSIILIMFASAAIVLTISQQRSASYFYQQEAALKAAEAGINYAMARLHNNPAWTGYGSKTQLTQVSKEINGKTSINIYEHYVNDDGGCVEGQVIMGDQVAYFDLYFQKPSNPDVMQIFKPTSQAGAMPRKIVLCKNNLASAASDPDVFWCDNVTKIANKVIPANSVFIVCRGSAGAASRIVESAFLMGTSPESVNSVAIGRGNMNLRFSGLESDGDVLGILQSNQSPDNEPSILRALGNMDISLTNGSNYPSMDYLLVENSGGGRAGKAAPTFGQGNIYKPANFSDNFKEEEDMAKPENLDKYLHKITLQDVMPSSNDMAGIQIQLKPGSYYIMPRPESDPKYSQSPLVYYIANDDPRTIDTYTEVIDKGDNLTPKFVIDGKDESSTFEQYCSQGAMKWQPEYRKLTLMKSTKVASGTGNLKNLVISTSGIGSVPYQENGCTKYSDEGRDRITIQVGPDPDPENQVSTYLLNCTSNNTGGGIYVDGQLSGTGTVICEGDLNLQAHSQMDPDTISGISLYGGKNINIDKISSAPYMVPPPTNSPNSSNFQASNAMQDVNEYNLGLTAFRKIVNYAYGKDRVGSSDVKVPLSRILTTDELNHIKASGLTYNLSENGEIVEYMTVKRDGISDLKASDIGVNVEKKVSLFSDGVNTGSGFTPTMEANFPSLRTQYSSPNAYANTLTQVGLSNLVPPDTGKYDTVFRGLVYACRDFNAIQEENSFALVGALVAYGGKTDGTATPGEGGNINITAKGFNFTYDSKYLSLLSQGENSGVRILYWAPW